MTRMSDNRLEAVLQNLGHNDRQHGPARVDLVRKHIAALTAERDEAVRREEEMYEQHQHAVRERDAVTIAWETAKTERDDLRTQLAHCAACAENINLRERVKALEAEQEAAQTTLEDEQAAHAETLERMNTAESRLAAIRQRAGEWSEMAPMARRAAGVPYASFVFSWESVEEHARQQWGQVVGCVARYIVGDDATAPEEMADTADLERTDYKAPPARDVPASPTAPEPTTAEAFAMVRELADEHVDDDEARCLITGNLALLERRMGAMARAAREAVWASREYGPSSGPLHRALTALGAAITDTPPVFTLEEVCKAMERTAIHAPAQRDVVTALTALRK